MSDQLFACFTFVGVWLLFVFPLYQGVLEVLEQQQIISRFTEANAKYPPVSPWYWLIPPLKVIKEKHRGIRILHDSIGSQEEYHQIFQFLNKAVAWCYIALAGMLNGFVATRELLRAFSWSVNPLSMVALNILIIALGMLYVYYRVNHHREQRMINKIATKRHHH
ncbi:hypothetical protein [Lapidilactobacillus wuchangensis]|uniref:hypothetical protein n=1 Tax=Lapidilactobacillus wuchangensis TaxID=2486001 RepID=UPI000F7B61BE|nr:hypothetical protein [Lapidilactobacillus wuchangensis]